MLRRPSTARASGEPSRRHRARRALTVLVVMGVSGSGKSTLAAALANRLHWELGEGDALHPAANIAKMAAGIALTDADRAPWLRSVRQWIDDREAGGRNAVIACSALRRTYRDVLRASDAVFVLLDCPRTVLAERLAHRTGHFMPVSLLDSQLTTLERPGEGERAVTVDCTQPLEAQVEQVVSAIGA